MLSSTINQKQQFQSIVTHHINQYASKKPKKRRKRRKKLQGNKNAKQNNNEATVASAAAAGSTTTTSTTTKVVQHKTVAKTKQYFQHDNRLGQRKETQIKHTLFSSSSSSSSAATSSFFNKYTTESELLYNEVAKKFKPLNPQKKQTKKAFHIKYNHAQRKLKLVKKQNLKNFIALASAAHSCSNQKINNSLHMAHALMPLHKQQQQHQLQHCLCSCQHNQSKCHNNTNIMESKSAVLCNNISKILNFNTTTAAATNNTSSSNTSANGITNCPESLPKLLELLQNHTPALLLETLINNAKLVEYNSNELNRYINSN